MTALFAHIEPSDDPALVWVRTSASPNPDRKPAMLINRNDLNHVLLMLLDAAGRAETC